MHLAQLNIGRLLHPQDDARVAGFMDNLALVNGLAERSDGFVWRLKGEGDGATDIAAASHPGFIFNLTVWRDGEALKAFVFKTIHKKFLRQRGDWFEKLATPHFVMWHVPAGQEPALAEALERLEILTREGPCERAFGWEGLADAELRRARQIAQTFRRD